jgi:hypothetical protein
MVGEIKPERQSGVDKGWVAMFLRMSPEERLQANDNALRAILELRHAYRQRKDNEHTVEIEFRGHTIRVLDLKMLIQLKRASTDPKDKQRLPVLEETLRQLGEEYDSE